MTTNIFQMRERALEYEFFHRVDEELWQNLRNSLEFSKKRDAIVDATGITDDAVIRELVELEMNSDTIFALSLFPLIWVAWADGHIGSRQRLLILDSAHAIGHERDTVSHYLINAWLDHEPGRRLQTLWKDYIRSVCQTLGPESRQSLRSDMLARASQVADAVNIRYGFHELEQAQMAVLAEIEEAFNVAE
jgi:hypothetical protein